MELDTNYLFRIIGEQQVEIRALREQCSMIAKEMRRLQAGTVEGERAEGDGD